MVTSFPTIVDFFAQFEQLTKVENYFSSRSPHVYNKKLFQWNKH